MKNTKKRKQTKRIFYMSEKTHKWNRFIFFAFEDFMFPNVNNSSNLFAITRWKILANYDGIAKCR